MEKKFKAYIYGYMCNAEVGNLSELNEFLKKALPITKRYRETAFVESKGYRFAVSVESDFSLRINWGKKVMDAYKIIKTDIKRMTQKNVEELSNITTNVFKEIYKEFTGKSIE